MSYEESSDEESTSRASYVNEQAIGIGVGGLASGAVSVNEPPPYAHDSYSDDPVPLRLLRLSVPLRMRVEWIRLLNVVLIGVSFCLLFTAFNATQSLQTTLNKDTGRISLSLIYGLFSLFTLVSSYLVKLLGNRLSLMISAATYGAYIASNIYVVTPVYLILSAVMGAGAAVLWTAQGAFLTENTTPETLSFRSGLFFTIYQTSAILSNLTAVLALKFGSTAVLFIIFTVLAALSVISFVLLQYPQHYDATDYHAKQDEASYATKLRTLNPLEMFLLFKDKRMLHMIPVIIFSGFSQNLFFGSFTAKIGELHPGDSPNHALIYVSLVAAVLGAADMSGSFIVGRLSNITGRKIMLIIPSCICVIGMIISWPPEIPVWVQYVTAVCYGLTDAAFNTLLMVIVGQFCKENTEPGFAYFKFIQSTTTAVGFALSIVINYNYMQILCFTVLVIGIVTVLLMDRFVATIEANVSVPYRKLPDN